MQKNIIIFIYALLVSTTILPIFDLSPWIVIQNATKFEMTCRIEANCYHDDFIDETITIASNNNGDLVITCEQDEYIDGNECINISIDFTCQAQQTKAFNPIFYRDDKLFNPEIKSVAFTHKSLQLTPFCNLTTNDQRYFTINYSDALGFTIQVESISIYIKCLNKFKQSLQSFITAALNATNHLPY